MRFQRDKRGFVRHTVLAGDDSLGVEVTANWSPETVEDSEVAKRSAVFVKAYAGEAEEWDRLSVWGVLSLEKAKELAFALMAATLEAEVVALEATVVEGRARLKEMVADWEANYL